MSGGSFRYVHVDAETGEIDPDRTVVLAWAALPFWIAGLVVLKKTLA